MEPVMDKLLENGQDIEHLKDNHRSTDTKLEEIKDTIFDTNGKLDVFEQINVKLAENRAEALALKDNLAYEVKQINDKIQEKFDVADRDHANATRLSGQCTEVMAELSKLKETYAKQCDHFVYEVNRCNKQIMDHTTELTERIQGLDKKTDIHHGRLEMKDSQVQELFGRMQICEDNIKKHEEHLQQLASDKVDTSTFLKVKKKLEMKNLEQDIKLFKNGNHCVTLDNYLEKYLPIHC